MSIHFPTRKPHAALAATALALAALCAGCSTTSALPEGEQLYTGISSITYTDTPAQRVRRLKNDSVGVITAVSNAVEAVSDVLSGKGVARMGEALAQNKQQLTADERKEQKAEAQREEADFATAREEVEAVLAYPPNNALFGSSKYRSPLQIGLWIHNGLADSKGKLGKWVYRTFGTEPVLVSSVSPEMRTKVATNTLHNYGYFQGKVGYEVLTQRNPRKAKVRYDVRAGKLYRLDSVEYRGFPAYMRDVLSANAGGGKLHSGDAFSVVNLSAEQTRIEELMRDNGFYYYSSGYTTFRADTVARPGYVQLQVVPAAQLPARAGHPWYIGHTYVSVRRSESDVLDKTLARRSFTFNYSGDKLPLRAGMWRRAIVHRRGEPYRLTDQQTTLEKLSAMGVLGQMDVSYAPRDTSATCDTLDVVVTALMDKLYDSTFEMNATMKSNQQIGPGVSYELAKRNAFGGGEKVAFKIFGSYEWQIGTGAKAHNSLLNSYELGTKLSLSFPRFLMPGSAKRHRRVAGSTQVALDADWRNRSNFYNMISMGLGLTYNWSRGTRRQHELTLFSLDFDKLLHTTAGFDSIMNANPALYLSMRDQFVPSLSYTFTYQSKSGTRNPLWLQLHAKEAGNVTSAIYAAAGQRFARRDKNLFGNPFAQFVKITAEAHKTFRLTSGLEIATRFFGGVVCSYGNSKSAPYSEQFYAGGANSVRAFTVRTLGPGSYRAGESKYAYMDQTGDIKLEANAELRAHLFGSLYGAVFLDAGNVWLLRDDASRPGGKLTASTIKNIALGTGIGVRYDLDFLVLRLDWGIGLHAPYATSRRGFYNIERFKDALGLHFAIGYPF